MHTSFQPNPAMTRLKTCHLLISNIEIKLKELNSNIDVQPDHIMFGTSLPV